MACPRPDQTISSSGSRIAQACRSGSAFHHYCVGGAISQALFEGRCPDENRSDQVDEKSINDTQKVAYERICPGNRRAICFDHAQTERHLAQSGSLGCFHHNEVGQCQEARYSS